jgi:hypothetical protein
MADMLGVMLRGLGVDPQAIMEQAAGLGAAFVELTAMQKETLLKLEVIRSTQEAMRANQEAMLAAMGLSVAPPSEEVAALIAIESRRHMERFGGPVEYGSVPLFPALFMDAPQ